MNKPLAGWHRLASFLRPGRPRAGIRTLRRNQRRLLLSGGVVLTAVILSIAALDLVSSAKNTYARHGDIFRSTQQAIGDVLDQRLEGAIGYASINDAMWTLQSGRLEADGRTRMEAFHANRNVLGIWPGGDGTMPWLVVGRENLGMPDDRVARYIGLAREYSMLARSTSLFSRYSSGGGIAYEYDPGHALALAGNLSMNPLLDELAASDAVLAIGTEFGETEMYPEPKPLTFGGPLIRIDIDPAQIVTGLRCDVPIAADAKLAAASLDAALGETRKTGDGAARAKAVREKVTAGLWPACRTHGRLMEIVTRALPDATVAGDQTEPVYAVNQFYQAPQVRSFFNSSTGYGTLGYGLPAAFGAKLGAPDRPSVCLIGDGGLQFSVQELASAVEAGIATAVVIWNNTSYGEIKAFMAERDIPQIGVDIFTPDFVGLAKALGCEASRPNSLAELEAELTASATRKVPTVIEIKAGSSLAQALTA